MGILLRMADRQKGLNINANDVLIKCEVKEGNITIPSYIKGVAEDAFKDCPDIKINHSDQYIASKLKNIILRSMEDVRDEFEENPVFTQYGQFYPNVKVGGVDSNIIESSIKAAIENEQRETGINWDVTVVDADDIPSICNHIASVGRDNLVKEEGDTVSTYKNIPFLMHWPVQQLGAIYQKANELISKEGFGILFIKNINEEIYTKFPSNFTYNLVKSHIFDLVRLSPKWIVVMEIGPKVKLDAPFDVGMGFNGYRYRDLTPKEFLDDMRMAGKLVKLTEEPLKSHGKNVEEDASGKPEAPLHATPKEIDWEERHFQICLALIQGTAANSGPANLTSNLIIKVADRVITALKKHHAKNNKNNS